MALPRLRHYEEGNLSERSHHHPLQTTTLTHLGIILPLPPHDTRKNRQIRRDKKRLQHYYTDRSKGRRNGKMNEPMQDKPQDLSMKSTGGGRKVKPIPPPLDLNARTLGVEEPTDLRLPKSPSDLPRECLPIRKRPLLEVRRDLHDTKSPKSAGPNGVSAPYAAFTSSSSAVDFTSAFAQHRRDVNTAPSSPLSSAPPRLPVSAAAAATLALTPSSASSLTSVHSAFTHFPVPAPLMGHHHHHHHSVAAAAAAVAALPKSPFLTAAAAAGNSGSGNLWQRISHPSYRSPLSLSLAFSHDGRRYVPRSL